MLFTENDHFSTIERELPLMKNNLVFPADVGRDEQDLQILSDSAH